MTTQSYLYTLDDVLKVPAEPQIVIILKERDNPPENNESVSNGEGQLQA